MSVEKTSEDKQKEAEQMQNVLLLLNHLIENEETTLKLIIGCLYEVGSVNLINQRVTKKQANRLVRTLAGMSKPVAQIFALRWFKKNCPQLIVNWLRSKVSFKPKAPAVMTTAVPSLDKRIVSEAQLQELKQLRGQVKILAGLLVCSMTALGGTAVWQVYQTSLNGMPVEPLVQPVRASSPTLR
ncbi:MAG: hypothetical protein ACFCU8_06865 [Thermosynechococcaceae cyanobacterium]